MKAIIRASRVNSAIQIIQHMNNGMTVLDACPEVGLPRSSFYAICKDNPEVIAEVQEMIEASSRQQLGLILMNKTQILNKVIGDALSDSTKPKERLAIYKALSEIFDDLTQDLRIESQASKDAYEFLKHGPSTQHQSSRLHSTDIS